MIQNSSLMRLGTIFYLWKLVQLLETPNWKNFRILGKLVKKTLEAYIVFLVIMKKVFEAFLKKYDF